MLGKTSFGDACQSYLLRLQPQLLEVPLEVVLIILHPALALEPGADAGAGVVQWEYALDRAHLPQVL